MAKYLFDYKTFLKNLSNNPGIYQMVNTRGEVLYIGKARNLKKRVTSYFRDNASIKTSAFIAQTDHIETIITNTENEALLLESNLIKKLKPKYNVFFRDDKSYPYIVLSEHEDYPRLDFYRGPKRNKGRFFGPYPSAAAVRETLSLMQKIFRIRSCQDSFFHNRTRPCLQYQIKRCTAPCVGYIDPESYKVNVEHAVMFLEGKSSAIIEDLAKAMDDAAQKMEFEKAAIYRDQIVSLRKVQQQQTIATEGGDVDVIAEAMSQGKACIQVLKFRAGRLLGSKAYFPITPQATAPEDIISAFFSQTYLGIEDDQEIPKQIIINHKINDQSWIENALSEKAHRKVSFIFHPHGEKARWLEIAERNAQQALTSHLAERATVFQQLESLQELLTLESIPQRIECFDVSHSSGEATVASCVVFDDQGLRKSDYRKFNIEGVAAGDDYGALRQALFRRYTHLKTTDAKLPDILMIDGGKGQLSQAEKILEELQVSGVIILAIAKGPTRKAGLETLFLSGKKEPIVSPPDSLALHLLQHIRDEAHRFAIVGHRGRRSKTRRTSSLEAIPGIGAKRRRELLRQFGGLQELKRASIEDLAKIPGISYELAERVYASLQNL